MQLIMVKFLGLNIIF